MATLGLLGISACDGPSSRSPAPLSVEPLRSKAAASSRASAATASPAAAPPLPARPADAAAPPSERSPSARSPRPLASSELDDQPSEHSRFVLDALNDVGPAAPASAFARGVVMVTRSDELALCKLSAPPSKSKKPAPGLIEPTSQPRDSFWPVARGPAVSATHAYWVSKHRLVRRALAGGPLEVLASDARDGTRVAVAGEPDAVAYITQPADKQDSRAKLRLADGRMLELTPEGSAASSVSLTQMGTDLLASFIDGRSGMTPVHARRLVAKTGVLEPDVVVWVAGATQGMTEVTSVGHHAGSFLLLPVEKDASHFGLASLALGLEPKMDPPLRWRTYHNGLDRAPTAGATVCGAPVAVYVRPIDARPDAHQELVVSELTAAEIASSEPLATARGFADVSLYPLPEGAILAYVADRRTWSRLIRCK
ncbi:MAG TPA: hypothetical protein VIW29_02555 [Polyangiaceae bacterium]